MIIWASWLTPIKFKPRFNSVDADEIAFKCRADPPHAEVEQRIVGGLSVLIVAQDKART
jgi:hypothetical protein